MGSGPVVSGLRGQGHLLRFAASLRYQLCDTSRDLLSETMAGTACRPACWPSALLLQTYDKVSDAEAKARADFDIRWPKSPWGFPA